MRRRARVRRMESGRWTVHEYEHARLTIWLGRSFPTWRAAYDYADRWTRGDHQSDYTPVSR